MSKYRKPVSTKQNCYFNKDKEKSFDPDSSPVAWEHYGKFYSIDNKTPLSEFDLISPIDKSQYYSNHARLLCRINKNSSESNDDRLCKQFKLGGDTDFNFNEKKYTSFREKLSDEENIDLLNRCKDMHHTLLNFSLMPVTGCLNNIKGVGYDRLDTFLYNLSCYFENKESNNYISKSGRANKKQLEIYLSYFNNCIYEYCRRIYFIEDKKFVDKLIEHGKKNLINEDNIKSYMNLAMEFWVHKEKKLKELEENKNG